MYRSTRQVVEELRRAGRLVVLEDEVDAHLEVAEIHRRVYAGGGPAVLYANVRGCRFPMVSNLFGDIDRARFLFRHTLDAVRKLIALKIDPSEFWRRPTRYLTAPLAALTMLPKKVRRAAALANSCSISDLPQQKSWPDDGGAFITLPQVYTEDAARPGVKHSNLGMYRIQLSGGKYERNREIGLHYQIHRGIGVHHAAAKRAGKPFRVNIFVGGTPAMTLAAVMPLPEGMSELGFAGALAGHRIPLFSRPRELPIYADADFVITGTVDPERLLPEGPFGDHLGYYSLAHDFPVLRVEHVHHRDDAVWPFTVVGRPPQEDTIFGQLIHELTGPIIPAVIPGVHAVHAVDASGVHPLLLAIGSERYTPYSDVRHPAELLTQASAILGQGQMSLAKYLLIAARDDDARLDIHDIAAFFAHVLRRVDWRRDLHFHTRTTIDTLDYSGAGLNEGSKLVIAACGPPVRELPTALPPHFSLPNGLRDPRIAMPGVLVVSARGEGEVSSPSPSGRGRGEGVADVAHFCNYFTGDHPINRFPLVVLVDDSDFAARTLNNFLWTTFTRSDPAADVHGVDSFTDQKHWGCRGALLIDARTKPHHAPPLVEDPATTAKINALAARGGPLAKWL